MKRVSVCSVTETNIAQSKLGKFSVDFGCPFYYKKIMKKAICFAALAASSLSGCGGGSSSSNSNVVQIPTTNLSPTPTPITTTVDQPLLQATPVSLPDLRPYFNQLCGDDTNIRNFLFLDLNKDGKKDIVVTMNCLQPTFGVVVTDPVKAGFVAFLQNSDGTFRLGTQSVFGQDMVRTSGLFGGVAQADFNKDGYDDFVLTLNREDGRAYADQKASNLNDQNLFVTSDGYGGYKIAAQGQAAWNYALSTMDNASGGKDVISQPIGYGGVNEQWTYDNGWKQLAPLNWAVPGTVFLARTAPNQGSTSALNPYWKGSEFGMSLYTRNQDWALTDKLLFGSWRYISWITWAKERSIVALVTMNNMDYVNVTLEVSCSMKLNKADQDQIAIFAFQGMPINGRYVEGTVIDETDPKTVLPPQTTLVAFQNLNGKLKQIDLRINNEEKNISPFRMYCEDVNGDGNSDIVVSDFRKEKSPNVYINSGSGSFSRLNPSNLPILNNPDYRDESFIYKDIDGDGFSDFMSYTTNSLTHSAFGKPVILKLYRGGRHARIGEY